jgi:carbon-monoxide dehydrogenase medium subunit
VNPAPFTYHRAGDVTEAIALLQQYQDEGVKLIAGGHSLLPMMKLRMAEFPHVIDFTSVSDEGLRSITVENGVLRIGALVTHRQIEKSAVIAEACPLLAEQVKRVGDRQVRARGTIGGTLAHADPAADYPAAMVALDAIIVVQGPSGPREIPATEFFIGLFTTSLADDEIITEVRIPGLPRRTGTNYQKLANQASGYAVVGVAAVVTMTADGTAREVRVGVTGAGDHAVRASRLETELTGKPLNDATIAAAAGLADEGVNFLEDLHASATYRRRVLQGLTERALRIATERAASA